MRRLLALGALLILGLAGYAQPPEDETFLTITLLTAAGAPCVDPVSIGVGLVREADAKPVPEGKVLQVDRGVLAVSELTTGPHLVTLNMVDGTGAFKRLVNIAPGANALEWRMPPRVAASGNFVRNGAPVSPTRASGYLMSLPERLRRNIAVTPVGADFNLPALFPGDYKIMLLTDAGYAVAAFSVVADTPLRLPVALLPGGTARIICHSEAGAPLAGVTLRLSNTVMPGFTGSVAAVTDAQGVAEIASLPPGNWLMYAYVSGYNPTSNVTVAVTAETVTETKVALKPVPVFGKPGG